MVGWYYQFNGHEFNLTLGDSEGQGSLACYSSWDCKELGPTQQLNNESLDMAKKSPITPFLLVAWERNIKWLHFLASACKKSLTS